MPKLKKMTKTDLKEIETKLLAEKAHLEKELSKIATKNPNAKDDYNANFEDIGSDESESVTEVEQYSLGLSLEVTLEKALRDVTKALESIKKGTYGLCKYCKQPIDKERLVARPTSTSCITCKTKLKSL
jgi:DnaK suppressor protein